MFSKSIEAVYLVEASPQLQKQQAKLLAGTEELKKSDIGWTAPLKYVAGVQIQWCEDIRFVPKGMLHYILGCTPRLTVQQRKHPLHSS
jgi:NADH dehydrogenase [ubiquinone] 1 alpha subcomplex assembly factor 7